MPSLLLSKQLRSRPQVRCMLLVPVPQGILPCPPQKGARLTNPSPGRPQAANRLLPLPADPSPPSPKAGAEPPDLLRPVPPTPTPRRGCAPGLLSTFSLYRVGPADSPCAGPAASRGLACAARRLSLGPSGLCTSRRPCLVRPLCGLDRRPPRETAPP